MGINQILNFALADGTWSVALSPHAAGGPIDFEIIHVNISIETTKTYSHISKKNNADTINLSAWFGDVWVCSGQSNMEMIVSQVIYFSKYNYYLQQFCTLKIGF
jgi:hypothetical protein